MIKKIINKFLNKETILYLVFGILCTLLNIITYKFCTIFNIFYIISNIIAWIVSVIFAFYTNKYFVFEKKDKVTLKEFISFISSRLFTGILDLTLMYITVSLLYFNDFIMKIFINIIVIILNYILSKIFVFKKNKRHPVRDNLL